VGAVVVDELVVELVVELEVEVLVLVELELVLVDVELELVVVVGELASIISAIERTASSPKAPDQSQVVEYAPVVVVGLVELPPNKPPACVHLSA